MIVLKEYITNCMFCGQPMMFRRLIFNKLKIYYEYLLVCPNCYIKFTKKDLIQRYKRN